jgi:hypothetical protein
MGCCGKIAAGAIGLAKAATGIGRADVDTVERRRAMCQACPEAVPCVGNIGKRCVCQQCGCLIRAKTAVATEQCPTGKW